MRCRGSAVFVAAGKVLPLLRAQAAALANKKERVRKGPLSYAIV